MHVHVHVDDDNTCVHVYTCSMCVDVHVDDVVIRIVLVALEACDRNHISLPW